MSKARDQVGEVFERYTHDVYGWAYRLLGRHHDALDVVQDVFVRWNSQCTQAPPRQPRGWLRKVTLNRALDIGRSRTARREAAPDNLASITVEPVLQSHPDQADLRHDVAIALESLTDMQRAVLVAKVYDELTFVQIAAELEVAVSTVKTHYLRAVQAVRAQLEPRWADEVQS